ncbi:hypothetical protein ACF05T_19935 [Streptomyces lateritius]|uniref:Peptidase inhibitor family I36 n=2 Tax=Streptomyces TaxID=1883 RepID=A0ABW6YFI8_9ACTN
MSMSTVLRKAGALAVAITAAITLGTSQAQATTAAGTVHGCPSGAFCIYPENAEWNNDVPSHIYWEGMYNLVDQYGHHYLLNNQTDGWVVDICRKYNGVDCPWYMVQGASWSLDLTEINSVVLRPR